MATEGLNGLALVAFVDLVVACFESGDVVVEVNQGSVKKNSLITLVIVLEKFKGELKILKSLMC